MSAEDYPEIWIRSDGTLPEGLPLRFSLLVPDPRQPGEDWQPVADRARAALEAAGWNLVMLSHSGVERRTVLQVKLAEK